MGIGVSSPATALDARGGVNSAHATFSGQAGRGLLLETEATTNNDDTVVYNAQTSTGQHSFETNGTKRMTINSSGHLLVGCTSTAVSSSTGSVTGTVINNSGLFEAAKTGTVMTLNRLSEDGTILNLRRSGTTVGSIGVSSSDNLYIYATTANHCGILFGSGGGGTVYGTDNAGASTDNVVNLGSATYKWKTLYAGTGSINTSDRNEKQDIEELNTAETAVAVACKGLLRKFRWKDSVEEKGDNARIHFGIIAQDLQAAFAAQGLDASNYGMWCSDTWWETQTEVDAVEAVEEVTDEEGNVTTEAVEAKDAYTRTDTFETLAEAPTGATERTRLGVRYSELLAFIIAAI